MANEVFYPPLSFYFSVEVDGFKEDSRFQEVSGLSVNIETTPIIEGGENRFVHQVPTRAKAEKLVLKRGFSVSSELLDWCRKAVEEFSFTPKKSIVVKLRNEMGQPLAAWDVRHAYPVKWALSNFNAMNNDIVIETLEIQYNYFVNQKIPPPTQSS